ncbi:hypothetical protein [Roseibium aggregatum]|uniref:Flagellar protein FlaG n=1 Tax=Roseibium aggregatum TaxID=187304 RepID=A0A926S7R5_9HYPH|nr:hypothetical protein [Roseibium aggregatum]MBD1547822.1 hypothetical protein [Roseibium aggregatum]
METGLARPPLPSYTAITPATRAPERNEPAAKTDLPASNTVTPAAQGGGSARASNDRNGGSQQYPDPRELSNTGRKLEHKIIVDQESNSIIYQSTDSLSGEVVRQIPSEVLRKLRAYAKTITDQANGNTPRKGVERTV